MNGTRHCREAATALGRAMKHHKNGYGAGVTVFDCSFRTTLNNELWISR